MYQLNQLHSEALSVSDESKLYNFHWNSTNKNAGNIGNITPVHCACINPNGEILKKILDGGGDLHSADIDGWQAIHYAAACKSSGPIKVLLEWGAMVDGQIKNKITPLHIAAMYGWAENCWEILKKSTHSLKVRVKNTSLTPLGYACINGDIETVKVLIEFGSKKGTAVGLERMPPLLLAISNNHYELTKYFVNELKVWLVSKDKFKRTPLIIAVMNGFIDIASFLL